MPSEDTSAPRSTDSPVSNGPQPVDMFCQNINNAAKVTPEAAVMQMGFAVIGELLEDILIEMRVSNEMRRSR